MSVHGNAIFDTCNSKIGILWLQRGCVRVVVGRFEPKIIIWVERPVDPGHQLTAHFVNYQHNSSYAKGSNINMRQFAAITLINRMRTVCFNGKCFARKLNYNENQTFCWTFWFVVFFFFCLDIPLQLFDMTVIDGKWCHTELYPIDVFFSLQPIHFL